MPPEASSAMRHENMNRTFHTQGSHEDDGHDASDHEDQAVERESAGQTSTMQDRLKAEKLYQNFRQGWQPQKKSNLNATSSDAARKNHVVYTLGDGVERSIVNRF